MTNLCDDTQGVPATRAESAPHDESAGYRRLITATSQVQETYYGLPVVKAPHWRWLIIVYFFLGGMTGASFTIGTLADLFSRDREVMRFARYLSFAALLPCPLLLILDLGRPERFLNMLRVVKLKSPMSLGSWALFFHSFFSGTAAALQLLADVTQRDVLPGPRRLIGILGLPFSVLLSGYTGVLLVATNIPVWWRAFPLLSPAFVSSAYSTSLAALSVLLRLGDREREDTARRIARAEVFCLSAELGFLTAGTIRLGKIGKPLTAGRLGMIFWPVVYVGGVLVPLILQLNGLLQSKREQPQLRSWSRPRPLRAVATRAVATRVIGRRATATEVVVTTPVTRRMAMAALTLVGGFAFRALMIFAGRESARRPQDYFEMTRSRDR